MRPATRYRLLAFTALSQVFVLALFETGCASAGGGIAAGLVTGKKAEDVIREAGETGHGLIADAGNTGNALAAKLGNELTVAAATASRLLGDQMHTLVTSISGENAKLLVQLAQMNDTARHFVPGAFALKDSMAVDLRGLLGESIIASRSRYFLQRIDGLTQLERPLGGDYKIELTGQGFGINTDKTRNRIIGIALASQQISWRENRLHAYVTEISLSNQHLASLFTEHQLAVVPITIQSEVEWKGLLGRWHKHIYDTPFYLSLMPKRGAELTVVYEVPKHEWVLETEKVEFSLVTGNHEQRGGDPVHYPYSAEQKALPGTRFEPPTGMTNSGEGCAWADQWGPTIADAGAKLIFKAEGWGRPCSYRYWARLTRDEIVGSEQKQLSASADYGRLVTITLPRDVTFWRVAGVTATKDEIELVNQTSSSLLQYVDRVDTGRDLRVTYRLIVPEGSYYSQAH